MRLSHALPATLLALLPCALLPGQTTATGSNRFVPENPAAVLRIASPAKWRKQFASTRAAQLGQGQALSPLLQMLDQQLETGLQSIRDSGMFDAALVEGLLNDWMGDIVVSVQVDWDSVADSMQFGTTPDFSVVVALTPDGSFDLAAVQRALDELIDKTKPEHEVLVDLAVGDYDLRRTDNGDGEPNFTVPAMIDGALVLLGGSDLDAQAAGLIGNENRWTGGADTSPLLFHFDVGAVFKALLEADADNAPVDVGELLDLLGVNSVQGLSLTIKPDGEAVSGSLHIGLTPDNRGLLNAIPQTSQPPKLLSAIPPGCNSFSVSTVDPMAMFHTVRNAWQMLEDTVPVTFDEAMQGFAEATKVRLEEDLLAYLGKELLVVQDLSSIDDADFVELEENPEAFLAGTVYGIALTDGRAFGTALDKMLRSRGLHASRKSEDYGNTKVHRIPLVGLIELEYSVTDDLLLIGFSGDESSRALLRGVLDTRRSGESGIDDETRRRIAALEPGWNGVALTPMDTSLRAFALVIEAEGELPPQMEMVTSIARALAQDMRRLNLNSMVSTTYCNRRGLTTHFRW